jgi:hypothetical protein
MFYHVNLLKSLIVLLAFTCVFWKCSRSGRDTIEFIGLNLDTGLRPLKAPLVQIINNFQKFESFVRNKIMYLFRRFLFNNVFLY